MAVQIAIDAKHVIERKMAPCTFSVNYIKSFNKQGDIVDEVHIMISQVMSAPQSRPQQRTSEKMQFSQK